MEMVVPYGKVINTVYQDNKKFWYTRDAQGNVMAVFIPKPMQTGPISFPV